MNASLDCLILSVKKYMLKGPKKIFNDIDYSLICQHYACTVVVIQEPATLLYKRQFVER